MVKEKAKMQNFKLFNGKRNRQTGSLFKNYLGKYSLIVCGNSLILITANWRSEDAKRWKF